MASEFDGHMPISTTLSYAGECKMSWYIKKFMSLALRPTVRAAESRPQSLAHDEAKLRPT